MKIQHLIPILFLAVLAVAQGQPSAGKSDPRAPQFLTNVPPGYASHEAYVQSLTNEAEVEKAAHSGFLSEDEIMNLAVAAENRHFIGIYGKVVDQDGNPLAGVEVKGGVSKEQGWNESPKSEYHTNQTDAKGLFQFTGLTGADWGVDIKKEGYIFDYMKGWSGPRGGEQGSRSTPANRVILTMYKQHGAEPMKHINIQSSVPCDGTPEHFNLLVSKMNGTVPDVHASVGDFTITLTRDPLIVDRRKPFNWSVTLSITNGGLLEYTNQPYPYEAPEKGYQSIVTLDFPTNMPHWQSEMKQGYYFKSKDGQVYGRMMIDLRADRPQPPTYFTAEIYANPAGSRNLEYDPQKQVR